MATEKEVIQAQHEQIKKYEALIKEMLAGPKLPGIVTAGPDGGLYRVEAESGGSSFIPLSPEQSGIVLKKGDHIMFTKEAIFKQVPELLEVKKDPPKFTFVDWSEIGGMKSQIEQIRDIVESPFKHAKIYKEFGQTPVKGILLHGAPGVGKTMIAKAIASYILKRLDTPQEDSFIYMKGGEVLSPLVGVAEMKIRETFDACRRHYDKYGVRSVLFIDEAEAILNPRGSRHSSDVDQTIVPAFLAEMDGFSENGPFIILATNYLERIDPAVQREGRIDIKIKLKRPTVDDAVEIFKIYLNKKKLAHGAHDLACHAAKCLYESPEIRRSISGAMIASLVNSAGAAAIKRKIAHTNSKLGILPEDLDLIITNIIEQYESESELSNHV